MCGQGVACWGSEDLVRADAQRTRRRFVLGAPGALVGGLVKPAETAQQELSFCYRPTFGRSPACYKGQMSTNVAFAGFVSAAICFGLIIDWALFSRLKMDLGAFGDQDEVGYRDLPRWRLVLIVIASAAVGISRVPRDLLVLPFWVGVALFVFANIYGVSLALRR